MTYNELVDAAKLRVRKLSNDALDEDVKTHVDFVLADLKRIGVNEEKYLKAPEDPLSHWGRPCVCQSILAEWTHTTTNG